MHNYLDFEKPISDLEGKIHELKKIATEDESIDTTHEVERLEVRAREAMAEIYSKLILAEDAGRAPSAASALPGICRQPLHRIHAARRRPQVRQ